MSEDTLKRVIWRLQELKRSPNYLDLRKAIMREVGTDDRTLAITISRMIELDLIEVSVSLKGILP